MDPGRVAQRLQRGKSPDETISELIAHPDRITRGIAR